MSTYVYDLSYLGTHSNIAMLENGKIYDTRKNIRRYIADVKDNKVYEVENLGRKPWQFITKENVVYTDSTATQIYRTPLYLARNGVIYDYQNYVKTSPVAEYTGDPNEALQCYVALIYFAGCKSEKTTTKTNNGTNKSYTSKSSPSYSESTGGSASTSTGGIFSTMLFLFLIMLWFEFCSMHKEYVLLIYFVIIPAIALVIRFTYLLFKKPSQKFKFSISNGFLGCIIAVVYVLFICFVTFFKSTNFSYLENIQIVNSDLCIIIDLIITAITFGIHK